jgi:hypothetical protein
MESNELRRYLQTDVRLKRRASAEVTFSEHDLDRR